MRGKHRTSTITSAVAHLLHSCSTALPTRQTETFLQMRSVARTCDLFVVAGCTFEVDNTSAFPDFHGCFISDTCRAISLVFLRRRRCSSLLYRRVRIWKWISVDVATAYIPVRKLLAEFLLLSAFRKNSSHAYRLLCVSR